MAAVRNFQSPTAWLLALFGLSLVQQAAIAFVPTEGSSDLTKSLGQNKLGLSSSTSEDLQKTPPPARLTSWSHGVDRLSKSSSFPLEPTSEASGDGSGLQENTVENGGTTPSTGVLEINMFILDGEEKRDLEKNVPDSLPPPAVPQKLMQRIIHHEEDGDGQDIIKINNAGFPEATSTASTTPAHIKSIIYENNSSNTFSTFTLGPDREKEAKKTTMLLPVPAIDGILNDMGSSSTENVKDAAEDKVSTELEALEPTINQTPDMTSVFPEPSKPLNVENKKETAKLFPVGSETIHAANGNVEEATSDAKTSSSSSTNHLSKSNEEKSRDDDRSRWFRGIFGPITDKGLSDTSDPCVLGLGPCVLPTSPNGTLLQWEDLRRTLAFAWELHVFGSAVLFLFVLGGAIWGVIGGTGMRRPFCGALALANVLMLLAALLRFIQFIVDPYGTRRILPRPVLAALYNLPLVLLLWAQVTLALLALKGTSVNLLTPALQRPHVTGGLATLHCASLLLADLLSHTLSPALPLMLQTLSICWGLPLCLGILFRALTPLRPAVRTPIPRLGTYKQVEERARRVLIVCALLGVLCCTLQIHGLLWLYGLLGDWRRFGWGWWLGQFWARLLELSWSFSLLLLGSRAFWKPKSGHRRGDQGQNAAGRAEKEVTTSLLERVLKYLPAGPWRKQEHVWADLLPNNWAEYKKSRGDIKRSAVRNYEVPTSVTSKDSNADSVSLGTSNYDSQSAPRWSHLLEWQERDYVLSLIEFDLCPPSPIELRRSIDHALHFGHLLGSMGSLFTPPPPSWTQSESSTGPSGSDFATQTTPTHIAYRWALDSGSSPISPQRFQIPEQPEAAVLDPQTFLSPDITSERTWERNSTIPAVNKHGDWISIASEDDITNL